MKLRKLISTGFKSFGDKTEFVFDDGVTCVVGPNGCGKSNVVDSIKWVLGEQSAKSLRGGQMMDVIFNGCSSRKPAAMAEVTLEFDNSAGEIQIDIPAANEKQPHLLSVTRRLYRSGESEYLINNRSARLKDIREMFLDTGIGGRSYSIIEQGRVAEMLQANPEQRRVIFEEVAGISRYKARKKEAQSKLDRVQQNLLRINDVAEEVAKRLRSIKYQAGKARNYQEYTVELSELRSLHSMAQYHMLRKQRVELQQKLDSLTDQATSATSRISQLEANHSGTESEMAEMTSQRRVAEGQIASISGQITALEQRIEMLQSRKVELSEQLDGSGEKISQTKQRMESVSANLEESLAKLDEIEAEIEACCKEVDALLEDQRSVQLALSELQGKLEDEKATSLELIHKASALKNHITACGVRTQSLQAQQQRITNRREELSGQIEDLKKSHTEIDSQLSGAQNRCDELNTQIEQTRNQASEINRQGRELDVEISEAKEKRSSLNSRRSTLEEMARRGEGLAEGVRKVLKARKNGKLEFVRGLLAEFIQVDMENASIVETALAEAEQYLLVDSLESYKSGGDELKKVVGSAAVKIFCGDMNAYSASELKLPAEAEKLSSLVKIENEIFGQSIEAMLSNIIVVNDLDAAREVLAANSQLGLSAVTRDGIFVGSDGAIRMGIASSAGIISRDSELAELATELEKLNSSINSLSSRRSDNSAALSEIEDKLSELRKNLDGANAELIDLRSRSKRLSEQIESSQRELPTLDSELQSISAQIKENTDSEAKATVDLEQVEGDSAAAGEKISALEKQISETNEKLQAVNRELSDMRVRHERALQQKSAQGQSISSMRGSLHHMNREITQIEQQAEQARQRIDSSDESVKSAKAEIENLYQNKEKLDQVVLDYDETLKGLNQRIVEIREGLNSQRQNSETLSDQAAKLQVRIGETDVRIEDLISRVNEEMSLDLVESYENYQHDDDRDWEAVAKQIAELKGKIQRLGNVNLDAIDEQSQLEERETFLAEQMADIEQSRDQLVELIDKINLTSRDMFEQTFKSVRETFQVIFRKLFGGGRADIILTEAEDVLEAGVEIIARPPGKELRSITLLSGGEKTMTTVALVFSIFRTKPSPFCILDEVDAALDEANNERFNMIVEEFLDQSQFIIITHSKRTMSIASALYGVTMQEAGVSRRVSVKFEQAAEMVEDPPPSRGKYVSDSADDNSSAEAEQELDEVSG